MIGDLPAPPPEPLAFNSIDMLAPKFGDAVMRVLSHMHNVGWDAIIDESYRSPERQAWLYGFGREYDDGRGIVTYSSTGDSSWHRYGLAVDVISKRHQWEPPTQFWTDLGHYATAEGLTWGGSWKKIKDLPHIQWGPPMRQTPSSRAVDIMAQSGASAVWREVGAA